MIYEGATVVDSSNLIFSWWKIQGQSETYLSDELGSTLNVNRESVVSATTFRCSVVYRGVTYTNSITLTDKTDNIIVSPQEPTPPRVGMLWLDTSRTEASIDLLKRCTGVVNGVGVWEEVSVSQSDLKYID
jgi:low affinity Fe/Cu permease